MAQRTFQQSQIPVFGGLPNYVLWEGLMSAIFLEAFGVPFLRYRRFEKNLRHMPLSPRVVLWKRVSQLITDAVSNVFVFNEYREIRILRTCLELGKFSAIPHEPEGVRIHGNERTFERPIRIRLLIHHWKKGFVWKSLNDCMLETRKFSFDQDVRIHSIFQTDVDNSEITEEYRLPEFPNGRLQSVKHA